MDLALQVIDLMGGMFRHGGRRHRQLLTILLAATCRRQARSRSYIS